MMQVRAFSRTQEILRYILSDMGDAVIVDQEAKVTDTDRIVLAKLVVIAFSTVPKGLSRILRILRQARTREDLSETPPIAAITVIFFL